MPVKTKAAKELSGNHLDILVPPTETTGCRLRKSIPGKRGLNWNANQRRERQNSPYFYFGLVRIVSFGSSTILVIPAGAVR